jgi:hypothetical protein
VIALRNPGTILRVIGGWIWAPLTKSYPSSLPFALPSERHFLALCEVARSRSTCSIDSSRACSIKWTTGRR